MLAAVVRIIFSRVTDGWCGVGWLLARYFNINHGGAVVAVENNRIS
jgi:hypothetical protein